MKKEMDCHDLQASLTKTKWLVILRFRKKAKYLKRTAIEIFRFVLRTPLNMTIWI